MGHVTTYSLDGIGGGPEYLTLLYVEAQLIHAGQQIEDVLPLVAQMLRMRPERLAADRERARRTTAAFPFAVHGSFDNVPSKLLDHVTEPELAERATPLFSRFVKGLCRPSLEDHCGDVAVAGAHPCIQIVRWQDLPPQGDAMYTVRPFDQALVAYPRAEDFFVPYKVHLDLTGFLKWVEHSRAQIGAHATLVQQIERECLF